MAGRPSRNVAILSRRQQVADLYLKGYAQSAIAEQLGVVQATVCNDLKRVRQTWRESAVRDFDELRSIELLKIERVEREAWAGWERSQQPQQTATIKGESGPSQKASKTMKSRVGDPRFLDVVARCSAHRRELLGLDLPAATAPLPPSEQDGQPLSIEDQRGQLLAMIESMKERAGQAEEAQRLAAPADEVIDVQVSAVAGVDGQADGAELSVNGESSGTSTATPS